MYLSVHDDWQIYPQSVVLLQIEPERKENIAKVQFDIRGGGGCVKDEIIMK